MKAFNANEIRRLAIGRFVMHLDGIHGPAHWDRVHAIGLELVGRTEADGRVVEAFAYLHDCCRESDGADPHHGERAGEFALSIRGSIIMEDKAFDLLRFACAHHEKGRTSEDPTVGACWDSDRLDLGRVGIAPKRRYLSTETAKRPEVLDWAYSRSIGQGVELKR